LWRNPREDKTSGGSVTRTVTYYPVAGAMRINSTLYYILKDHLGSASVVTDASGNIVGENRYYPFGETRAATGSILTDRLFTGQREMTGLGIYHYGARFYSPKLGRFLSPDSIVPGYANPQNLNRFSYTVNNPLRYTDPTGHMVDAGGGGGGGGCNIFNSNCNTSGGSGGCNTLACGGGGNGSGSGGNTGGGGCNTLACASNNGNENGPDIFVPVSGGGGPDIFVPVSGGGGPDIFVPVFGGGGGPDIFVPVFGGGGGPDIFIPLGPEDIWNIFTEDPEDILMPGGVPIGTQEGDDERTLTIPSAEELNEIFNALTVDATPFTPKKPYPGQLYLLPNGGLVGSRNSEEFGPTIDIRIPGIPIDKLHLPI